jgi:hypothetical protein
VCSPSPYRLGASGSRVRNRRYWVSKMKLVADVSNSVSLVSLRMTMNEKGFSVQENLKAESEGSTFSLDGRGKTDSGT